MKREELEKEADKESYKYNKKYSEDYKLKGMLLRPMDFIEGAIEDVVKLLKIKAYRDGYLVSAEPREKQIQIDAEQIRALQKQNGELTDKVKELEAQIEKMKCCDNCQHCGCGSCDEAGNCICDDCNEETLSEWECIL